MSSNLLFFIWFSLVFWIQAIFQIQSSEVWLLSNQIVTSSLIWWILLWLWKRTLEEDPKDKDLLSMIISQGFLVSLCFFVLYFLHTEPILWFQMKDYMVFNEFFDFLRPVYPSLLIFSCAYLIVWFFIFRTEENNIQSIFYETTTEWESDTKYKILFFLVIILAIYLRFPKWMAIQTFHDLYASLWVFQHGIPQMDSWVIYWRAFPFSYSLSPFIYLHQITWFSAEVLLKIPVFLYSFGTVLVFNGILSLLKLRIKYRVYMLFFFAVSTWLLTYAWYLRFFSMLDFFIYFSLYMLMLYNAKQKKVYLIWFLLSCIVAFFIEKTALLCMWVFLFYGCYRYYFYWKNTKELLLHAGSFAILCVSFVVAYKMSQLNVPWFFENQVEVINAAKSNIFTNLSFNDYYIRVISSWYPFFFIFLFLYILFVIFFKKYQNFIYIVFLCLGVSIFFLSFLWVSKNVPRILSFYGYIFIFITAFVLIHIHFIFRQHKLIFVLLNLLVVFYITKNISFFILPPSSTDYIPQWPIRISNAETFRYIHDMSLATDFAKDVIRQSWEDTVIVSTHSAAWENFYLKPYKVSYILNDLNPEKRFTTAYNSSDNNHLYSLYRGIKIIDLDSLRELNTDSDILVLQNYDYKFRVTDSVKDFFDEYEPDFVSKEDNRVKAYYFRKGSLLDQTNIEKPEIEDEELDEITSSS